MKRKKRLYYFVLFLLVISVVVELSHQLNIPLCRETEGRGEIYENEEIISGKNDYRPVELAQDMDIPALERHLHSLDFFATLFEPGPIATSISFLSALFNHSPPLV